MSIMNSGRYGKEQPAIPNVQQIPVQKQAHQQYAGFMAGCP
jgi:hypothetical protein